MLKNNTPSHWRQSTVAVGVILLLLQVANVAVNRTLRNTFLVKLSFHSSATAPSTATISDKPVFSLWNYTHFPEITFTNLQWFHPSEVASPTIPRCLAMKEFADAIEANPRYNASLWSDLHQHPDPERPILAFLDTDLCHLIHWPKFGGDWVSNYDTENGRPPFGKGPTFKTVDQVHVKDHCDLVDLALASPAMTASPHSRLVVLTCDESDGPFKSRCLGPNRNATLYKKLVVGHMTKQFSAVNAQDFGLPPWPVKTIDDLPREKVCNDSLPYLLSFNGRFRANFPEFHTYFSALAKQRNDIYANFGTNHYDEGIDNMWKGKELSQTPKEDQSNETYYQLMTQSTFCPVPRGDCIYSVRFSEVMSAGCIPIIYANGWVLPYTRTVVDWQKLAVIIPQQHVHQTLAYVEQMSKEEICERRLMAYDFFHEYVKDGSGRLSAILKIMDERLRTGRLEPFQVAPGISSHKDSLAMYQK